MSDKMDALDLVLSVLKDHEKVLDEVVFKLEKLEKTMSTFIEIVNEADLQAMKDRFRDREGENL